MTLSVIADVTVDCTLSVDHKYANEVSSHPAESGADFTDNSANKPLEISLDCIISNTPVGLAPNASFGPNIVEGVQGRLVELNLLREPITVVDTFGRFDNMQIENLTFSRTSKNGEALAFKISFKQLIIITNSRTIVQVSIPNAQGKQVKGSKNSKQPPDPPISEKTEDLRTGVRRIANLYAPGFISNKPNQGGGFL